ncbi:uncharacterized protein TNCT_284241 [Trichonephila clavata]|uniref:Uncharacterized protein n=1 Tax=Trichonephila clavata TaxID=2740835 RepID=A0A8X6LMF4_TRICU|nr:uncharacterized protein TNCT_284241 [Trichonephila clavata]
MQKRLATKERELETLHPVPPSEPSAEPTVSVDEISTKLFDTFEQLLHRKLSKDHLKHMLKTFQLDEHFNGLESNIRSVPQLGKTSRQKVLTHVNHTKYKVKQVIESFFQKLSTLFGSDLPSLCLMERLDFLEQKYLAKNTQLAEEPTKLQEFVRQYLTEIAFSENWQELFSNERKDLDSSRTQLVLAIESPSNYKVTEVVENLPAICGVDADSELKQERDQLKVERDQLKEENDQYQLKTERNQLKDEKGQLRIENGLLKENRDTFWKETEILRNEKDVLKAERDQILKGNDRLKKERNVLKVEGDQWKQRCTELKYELNQEKYRLAEHCNVFAERIGIIS